jgi:hypothetical protein
MDPMPQPAHARTARRPEGLIAAWLCMIIAGVTTVTFNVWHAFHSAMAWPVAVLVGIAPVALAMVVSHLVAVSRAGKFLKTVTFAVMVGAMALSVRATGAVVAPAFGSLWWLFGAVIDTGALVALQVLLSLKAKAARDEAQRAADEAAAADERTALRAELEALAAEVEPLREALAAAQREAGQANEKAESLAAKLAARKPNRTRTKAPNAGRRKAPNAAPNGRPNAAPNAVSATEVPGDFDARAEALEIYLGNPRISGKDLGARVGLGERWGQLRKAEFDKAASGSERSGERS